MSKTLIDFDKIRLFDRVVRQKTLHHFLFLDTKKKVFV